MNNSLNKCDCCSKFGELETVTLEIKKHKECDVNTLFGGSVKTGQQVSESVTQAQAKAIGAPIVSFDPKNPTPLSFNPADALNG